MQMPSNVTAATAFQPDSPASSGLATPEITRLHPAVLAAIRETTGARGDGRLSGEAAAYLVKNTFIDDVPQTPDSPFGLIRREIQSCPGTALLSHHFPRSMRVPGAADIAAALANHKVSDSPSGTGYGAATSRNDMVAWAVASAAAAAEGDCNFQETGGLAVSPLGSDLKPWGDDVVAALVKSTAALVRELTPKSKGLQVRPEQRVLDPVAAAVAAATSDFSATSPARSLPRSSTPPSGKAAASCCSPTTLDLETVVRTPPSMIRSPLQTPTPTPTHADARSDAMFWNVGAASWIPDAKAMAESFAALVAEDSSPSLSRGSRRISSGGKWWHPLQDISEVEEPNAQAFSGYEAQPQVTQVHQELLLHRFMEPAQPAQTETLPPWRRRKAAPTAAQQTVEDREMCMQAFVQEHSLDERCLSLLQSLPSESQDEALSEFQAPDETRNRSAKFMAWVGSKWRHLVADAIVFDKGDPPTVEELLEFELKWGLDERSRRALEDYCPTVQREIISNFAPPEDTKKVDARFTSFANCVAKKMASSLAAEATSRRRSKSDPTEQLATGQAMPATGQNIKEPNKPRPQKQLQQPVPVGDVNQHGRVHVEQFTARWGLDASSEVALRSCSDSVQQAAMSGFHPSARTMDHNKKFVAYLKMVQQFHGRPKQYMQVTNPLWQNVP